MPLPDERTYWFATRSAPAGGVDTDAREELLSLFGAWHAPIADLIRATASDQILRHDIHDLARFPRTFVHRRGVLLGDAAHGMTPDLGQGAGQAIEDAATLALLLRGTAVQDLDGVLGRFDRLRRARTRGIWSRSRLMGRVAQIGHPVGVRLRDTALRATPASLASAGVARLQRWEPLG